MATAFKPTILNTYTTNTSQLTQDQIDWKLLSHPRIVKEHAEINYVDACPSSTQLAAVSVGPKVVIYNCYSGRAVSTISRFSRSAHGATYRPDGQLLVAGSEDSYIHLFDTRNNDQLRVFKGHKGPVRRVNFITGFPPRLVSFSDDKTCGIWDISDEKKIMQLEGHTDNIRAGCVNPSSPHCVISGSDDRTVRVWDTRTGATVHILDHNLAHVNDVLCFPSGNMLATAAGNEVRIWDLVAGKLLSRLCRHHKDVTSLCLAGKGSRLVSGSLDRHLKFYDTTTYNVVHTIDCPAAVLSFAITPEDKGLVVGMIDESKGLISLQRKNDKIVISKNFESQNLPGPSTSVKVIKEEKFQRLNKCDKFLKSFRHTDFLRAALNTPKPGEVVGLLSELIRVGGLQSAVAGHDAQLLKQLFTFLDKHLNHPSYQSVLLNVVSILLDVYAGQVTSDSFIAKRLLRLHDQLQGDIEHTKEMLNMEHDIDMILADARRTAVRSN